MGKHILVLNGPNLNLLGTRQPEVYGHTTLADVEEMCRKKAKALGITVDCRQSNYEGQFVDWIQEYKGKFDGILYNPGAYTHTSVAIHDAIAGVEAKVVEVHVSNIHQRESFRHHSYVSLVAVGVIAGLGVIGYELGLEALARME
ncbi:MAG: type II 3-dehydroquinate dehydratase [Rhodospirillales bacterium]|jgi:3-dehydroquinate dehydratase II|nr:type II 3-dehydroquinate dehydratase [Rhodospirillales bacterium]